MKIEFWWRQIFEILIIHKPSLGSLDVPQKNVGPIGSAVLTFIGYKTNKQTDKPNLYIDSLWNYSVVSVFNLNLDNCVRVILSSLDGLERTEFSGDILLLRPPERLHPERNRRERESRREKCTHKLESNQPNSRSKAI